MQMRRVRRHERKAQNQGAYACQPGGDQANGDPAAQFQREVRLYPLRAGHDVLRNQANRQHQAGHKATAGRVVSTQKQMHRQQGHDGQQKTHQYGRHHQVAYSGV